MISFRPARRSDVAAVVALLRDDHMGAAREAEGLSPYLAAFDRMAQEGDNLLIVGEQSGRIVATFQLTFITGLSLRAARRAQIESVRVAADLRGQGIGAALMAEADRRARAAGCTLMQFTSNASRKDAHRFYARHGFTPSHTGFKKPLD
ncbi:GNAT family N-acetyltransferase [Poseidonocella sedimentorum]|uniref:Predicted N-acetyltransferase YhbS n=1 Tax=Poseidonocella sedimentorum TaxID=871652 RepID=A0A1I6DPU9_9RHOB|nr:GNAT family N-acetyltransferase [Poseidonocella sedimentorum]SFR07392.1 Predicted N-acetyltransferase YhbS [Poseidonocella sedimentorum]